MTSDRPTIGELHKAKAVTGEQIDAAARAYLADPATSRFAIAEGVALDLAAAIYAHAPSRDALAAPRTENDEKRRWQMVRTAIILARGTFDGGG